MCIYIYKPVIWGLCSLKHKNKNITVSTLKLFVEKKIYQLKFTEPK